MPSTGHAALDAHLPGGGWPLDGMVEVLHAPAADQAVRHEAHAHVWRLLLPALVQAAQREAGPIVLIGAPFAPFGPSLRGQGLAPERLLCIRARQGAMRLWAAEQVLRCAEGAAVMAWLPQARASELRRLHLAAQRQRRLLWVFRPEKARHEATPARLRLLLEGNEELRVHILKRRGPPLEQPVVLPAHPSELDALLRARYKGFDRLSPALRQAQGERGGEDFDRLSPALRQAQGERGGEDFDRLSPALRQAQGERGGEDSDRLSPNEAALGPRSRSDPMEKTGVLDRAAAA